MVRGRPLVPLGTTSPGDPPWKAIGSLCAVVVLCAPACADLWGFADLGSSSDGGEIGVIAPSGGIGGHPAATGAGGAAPADGEGGAAGQGGATGQGGTGGPAGSGGTSGLGGGGAATGGATGAGGAGGGLNGTGGRSGLGGGGGGGAMGGATGTGGRGVGGVNGAGGATGGATGTGGAGVGGMNGTGGAPGCGPGNCANGCCAAGRCITTMSAQQCGRGGAACTACGGCQLCAASGACAIDPASRWIIRCASAELTVTPPTGATWDPAGVAGDGTQPDPFCQFERPPGTVTATTAAATRTVNDSFTATWNQTVTPGTSTITAADLMAANADTWRVWVGDNENNGRGTLACQVRPPLPASALVAGQSTVTNLANCVSLTLTLVCQP